MRPADDVESLAYTLTYLAAGNLPWKGRAEALALSKKRELLESSGAAGALTKDVHCSTTAAALQALWAEVRRCHGDGGEASAGTSVDYEACLASLSGGASAVEAETDVLSESCMLAAIGGSGTKEGVVCLAQLPIV